MTILTPELRVFNLQKQEEDVRDFQLTAKVSTPVTLPSKFEISIPGCPKPYNQGSVGSCTANAISFAFQGLAKTKKLAWSGMPSRLFLYYNSRVIFRNVDEDTGVSLRVAMKALNKQGVCPEAFWKYDETKWAVKPSDKTYTLAEAHKSLAYYAVNSNNLVEIKTALVQNLPVITGHTVFASLQTDPTTWKNFILPMPKEGEQTIGGHAMAFVGYDDSIQCFKVRNSWGDTWGDKGHLYIPYEYVVKYGFDFWVLSKV